MRNVRLLSLIIVFLSFCLVMPQFGARAQTPLVLTPGQLTTAEFTDAAPEVQFVFTGKQNEQYVVTFNSTGSQSIDGDLKITDSSGTTLAEGDFVTKQAFVTLPADGDYTVTASRTFSDNGPFAVQLLPVTSLSQGQTAQATITSQVLADGGDFVGTDAFFSVQSDSDFKLTITPGQSQAPDGVTADISYTISLPDGTTIYSGSGDQFIANSVALHGANQVYLLTIGFNGYSTSGTVAKGDTLTHDYTVAVDALQP